MKWEYTIYSHKQPSGMLFRGAGDIPVDEITSAFLAVSHPRRALRVSLKENRQWHECSGR
jgi:hypothetical protein